MKKILLSAFFLSILSVSAAFPQKENEKIAVLPVQPTTVSYGIVVDNSGSYRLLLDRVIDIVKRSSDQIRLRTRHFLSRLLIRTKFACSRI